jgi:hypothetical protein
MRKIMKILINMSVPCMYSNLYLLHANNVPYRFQQLFDGLSFCFQYLTLCMCHELDISICLGQLPAAKPSLLYYVTLGESITSLEEQCRKSSLSVTTVLRRIIPSTLDWTQFIIPCSVNWLHALQSVSQHHKMSHKKYEHGRHNKNRSPEVQTPEISYHGDYIP